MSCGMICVRTKSSVKAPLYSLKQLSPIRMSSGGIADHCTHQAYVEREQLEGGEIFIELQRHCGRRDTIYAINKPCINKPLYGDFKLGGTCAFFTAP